jgi:acyl-CoA dehydrogenase
MAARDIRALPKLEGTVHVNIALIVKFMPNYFFSPAEYPPVPRQDGLQDDVFLFNQGPARGLGKIRFHDYNSVFNSYDLPNVKRFQEQVAIFKEFLAVATPDDAQRQDVDFLLALGEIFALVVYAQLVLENARIYAINDDTIDQIFDFMIRDFSKFALQIFSKPSATPKQMDLCLRMIRKPTVDAQRYQRVWQEQVYSLRDTYEMNA